MHEYSVDDDLTARSLAEMCIRRLAMKAPLDLPHTYESLLELAGATITEQGLGGTETLRLWDDVLAPACLSVDNPRYLSFIPSAPTRAAAAFDMLVGVSSVYAGSWLEGSGAVYAENQALRWIADLCGLPQTSGGVFVQGGTGGNLSALVAAREVAKLARTSPPLRWGVCVTQETHSSVKHALTTVMDVDVIEVPGDDRGRMTGNALEATVRSLPDQVRDGIFAVVGLQAAPTSALSMTCWASGQWPTSTAGGSTSMGRTVAQGWPRRAFATCTTASRHADSFIVDPHKWLFAPFDCCALIYRDPEHGRAAHTQHADYLDPVTVEGEWNPSDYAIQLSRRARGLPFWFSLAMHGRQRLPRRRRADADSDPGRRRADRCGRPRQAFGTARAQRPRAGAAGLGGGGLRLVVGPAAHRPGGVRDAEQAPWTGLHEVRHCQPADHGGRPGHDSRVDALDLRFAPGSRGEGRVTGILHL